MTREEALKKGYLSNEKFRLKPVIRGGRMINDPTHVGYFMFDGATVHFVLPQDSRGALVSPFKSEEERQFFEKELDVDLNIHKKKDNFWHDFYVKITKDAAFMHEGTPFDMSDPLDNIRVRVLRLQNVVADGWDNRLEKPDHKFVLVSEDFEELSAAKEMDTNQKLWTYFGSIKDSPKKMKDFLSIYLITKKVNKEVPKDASREFLTNEINRAFKEDTNTVLEVIDDPDSDIKLFISKAIQVGAIEKRGVSNYVFTGEEVKYTLKELIGRIKNLKELTDDIYLKIEAQIKQGV